MHKPAGSINNNWPVYRYSEVLLLLAEALNELGRAADVVPLLNQVKSKVGLCSN